MIGEDGPLLIFLVRFKNLLRIQWVEYQDYTGPGFGLNAASFLCKTACTFALIFELSVHSCNRPEYVMTLGDNFYYHGVENDDDPMFENTFERVYAGENLQCPWYFTTGNHDWSMREDEDGQLTGGNATAQILYSAKSERWTFPDLFYKIDTYLPSGLSQRIVVIDTPSLTGVYSAQFGFRNHPFKLFFKRQKIKTG